MAYKRRTVRGLTPEEILEREEYLLSRARAKIRKSPGIQEIEFALMVCNGNITKTAEYLGYENGGTLRAKVFSSPRLQKLLNEIMQTAVDHAQEVVLKEAAAGNMQAAIFTLKTLGKDRGFTERNVIEHDISEDMKSSAKLIEAMRKELKKEPETIDVKEYTWEASEPPSLVDSGASEQSQKTS